MLKKELQAEIEELEKERSILGKALYEAGLQLAVDDGSFPGFILATFKEVPAAKPPLTHIIADILKDAPVDGMTLDEIIENIQATELMPGANPNFVNLTYQALRRLIRDDKAQGEETFKVTGKERKYNLTG